MRIRDLVLGRATLLIVMSVEDCLGCANFPMERKILNQSLPELAVWMIGSGDGRDTFVDYFGSTRSDDGALLDPDRALSTAVGIDAEPLAILLDVNGRIVLADNRTGSETSRFRISQVLQSLSTMLSPGER